VRTRASLIACGVALAASLFACVPVSPASRVGETLPPASSDAIPKGPIAFEYESVDERSVSAAALRGKPAVLAFVVSDTMAGQGEADVLLEVAQQSHGSATFAIIAVEPPERRELFQAFMRFFADKSRVPLLGAMADRDTLLGLGPFGDVRAQTVFVLDSSGSVVMRKTGIVKAVDITRALLSANM
jgi:hypothetical protein